MFFDKVSGFLAGMWGRWRALREHVPYYVVEGANWSIDWDGTCIAREIRSQYGLECRVLRDVKKIKYLRRQLLHFGSLHLVIAGYNKVHLSNVIVGTVFHGSDKDPAFRPSIEAFRKSLSRLSRVVVPSSSMFERVKSWGVPEGLVTQIPIGIDLDVFRPPSAEQRMLARNMFQIPPGSIVLGSFQKDGVGWSEGLEPKMVKGPDVFLAVVSRLRHKLPLFVLLTGPARGYVIKGLEKLGVAYKHLAVPNYSDMASCYHALDLYIVASREEGGPKAILEAMATGVPVVSTRVGMAPDLIENGESGFLCEIEDVEKLVERALELASSEGVRDRFREKGLEAVQRCNIKEVGRLHYEKVYAPLLKTLS